MSDCLFCKIAHGEISSEFIYEDDDVVVFRDIHPKAKTHLLVVPKKHSETVMSLQPEDETLMGKLIFVAKEVAATLGLPGYRLQINVGKDGGQEIFHIHMHLLSNFG